MAQTQMECAQCGLARNVWKGNDGQGYRLDGEFYCCQECAEETGCTCQPAAPPTQESGSALWGEN